MLCRGYKLSGYDATYRKALFNVCERGNENRVLEITDVESGQTFLIELESAGENKQKTRAWHKEEPKGQGKYLHFGKAGFTEQVKYSGRKKKDNI